MTRLGWLFICGSIIGLWLLMPIVLAIAGAQSEHKPTSSAAELRTIRGVVKATAQATLASQVQGRISQLPFKEGQRFTKAPSWWPSTVRSMRRNWRARRRNIAARN
jgi:multidrug efflux pump subunit AcrA (membrane-fusion protein)